MSRPISSVLRRAINSQETDVVPLILVVIDHEELDEAIRVVRNGENVTSRGNLYNRYPFDITLPDDVDGTVREVNLTIDNVDRSITKAIRQIVGEPEVTLEVVLAEEPDIVEAGPFDFKLRDVTYNAISISGQLAFEDILNLAVVRHTFTPANFGGLF